MSAECVRDPRWRWTCDNCTAVLETDGSYPPLWEHLQIATTHRGSFDLDVCGNCLATSWHVLSERFT